MKRKAGRKAKPARAKRPRPVRVAAKTKPENSIDAFVVASAQTLSLELDPVWHKTIAFNLRLILSHAALVDGFALPDDAEPAPVFHA
ncbi:MAG: DUF4089 domain-containing protein [Xanthobacteraceae bacterium]